MTENKKILEILIVGAMLLASIIGTVAWLTYPNEFVPGYYAGVSVKYNTVEKVYDHGLARIDDPFAQLELVKTISQNDKHAVILKNNVTLYSNIVWRVDRDKVKDLYKKFGGDKGHPVSESVGRWIIQSAYRTIYPEDAKWTFKKPNGNYKDSLLDPTLQNDLLQIRSVNASEIENARLKIIENLGKEGVIVEFLEIKSVPEPKETNTNSAEGTGDSWGRILFAGLALTIVLALLLARLIKKQ